MSAYLTLPTEKEALIEAIDCAVDQAVIERNRQAVEWFVVHFYLQGHRVIDVVSREHADVRVAFEDRKGELHFAHEALLHQYRVEVGRYLRMSTHPTVNREGHGLQSVRDAGISFATLRHMSARAGIHGIASPRQLSRFVQVLLKYGTAALHHFRIPGKDIGTRTAVEVVPPWELLSIPAQPDTDDDVQGIMRHRRVPIEWVQSLKALKLPRDLDLLHPEELPFGASPSQDSPEGEVSSYGGGYGGGTSASRRSDERRRTEASKPTKRSRGTDSRTKKSQLWVTFTETWLYGAQDFVNRYIVKIGDAVPLDEDYSGEEDRVVCPLSIARCIPVGGFYGRSWVGSLLSQNYQTEQMLANQFQNVADADLYPFTVVPAESGLSIRDVRKPERRKVLMAQTDPVVPNAQVYAVEPHNAGDMPLKTAAYGVDLQAGHAGQSELLAGGAPGRVDSASALGFLWETGNVGLVTTTNEIADAYVQTYASMLQAARRETEGDPEQTFRLPLVDDRMIGVRLDPESGSIKLADNPIPHPWEVSIDVEERVLKSREQTRQEAGMMVETGAIEIHHFRIMNERDGWQWPILSRADYEAWRKAQIMKILLFNDGKTPGPQDQIIGGAHSDRPQIILEVLGEFMGSTEFMIASREVRTAFIELKMTYERMLGGFPNQLPRVDEMANIQAAGAGGGGPGGPGGQGAPGGGGGGGDILQMMGGQGGAA